MSALTNDVFISVVTPAHNEAQGLQHSISVISTVLEACARKWEIVIVDDGSTDQTFDVIRTLSEADNRVKGVRLSRNFGKEAALLCGLKAVRGDAVITIDSDLQHPPSMIPEMIQAWRNGARVVHATKRSRDYDNFLTLIRAQVFNRTLSRLAKIDLNRSSDFKLLDRLIVDNLVNALPERQRFYRGLAGWVGFPSATIEFDVDPRSDGKGKWSFFRLVDLAVTAVVSFTSAPLRVVTILGVLTLILGLVVGTDAIWSWFHGKSLSGFATIVITLLIVGSSIMISLGVLGEYVAKIYDEVKRRPAYFVESEVGFDEGTKE